MVVDNEKTKRRTVKACDRCRLKKIKCDGHIPCLRCLQGDAICHFGHSTSSEGRSVSAAHFNQLQVHNEILVEALRRMWTGHGHATNKEASIHQIVQGLGVLDDQQHLIMDLNDFPAPDSVSNFSMYDCASASQSVTGDDEVKPLDGVFSPNMLLEPKDPTIKSMTAGTYFNDSMDSFNPTTSSHAGSSNFDHVPPLTDDGSASDKTSRSSIAIQRFYNDNNLHNDVPMHDFHSLEQLHEQKQSIWPTRLNQPTLDRPNRPKEKVPMPQAYRDELMQQYPLQRTIQQPSGVATENGSFDTTFTHPADCMMNSLASPDFDSCMIMGDINDDTLHWYQQQL